MNLFMSSIVQVSMNKMALWISACVNDWEADRAVIASNVLIGQG